MAGVSSVITAFQTLHAGITGVKTAPTAYPGKVTTADLPMVLTFPGQAITQMRTFGANPALSKRSSLRDYSIRLFVEPAPQDRYDNVMQSSITLLQRFLDEYYDNFILAANLAHIVEVRDSGVVTGGDLVGDRGLMYAGIVYTGVIFEVNVQEWTDTTA